MCLRIPSLEGWVKRFWEEADSRMERDTRRWLIRAIHDPSRRDGNAQGDGAIPGVLEGTRSSWSCPDATPRAIRASTFPTDPPAPRAGHLGRRHQDFPSNPSDVPGVGNRDTLHPLYLYPAAVPWRSERITLPCRIPWLCAPSDFK